MNRHVIYEEEGREPLHSRKSKVACLNSPEALWKSILWTDEYKMELFGHNRAGTVFGEFTNFQAALQIVRHDTVTFHLEHYVLVYLV